MKNNYKIIALVIVFLIGGIFFASQIARNSYLASRIDSPQPTSIAQSNSIPNSPAVLGIQTKTADCQVINGLPDYECTPGAIFPTVTETEVCKPGYSSAVRHVTQATKNKVFKEYNLPTEHQPGEYEVDHLISLELGGSNDISNLFPEAAEPRPGYHEKDKVENYLHDQVCKGAINLQQAQLMISRNWQEVYKTIAH